MEDGKIVEHWGFPEKILPQRQSKNNNGMLDRVHDSTQRPSLKTTVRLSASVIAEVGASELIE
jgi:hypothetical protein